MTEDLPTIETSPGRADVDFLEDQINAFNVVATGIDDGMVLSAFVRAPDGRILAGLYGWTWGGTCEVRYLWVEAELPGHGYGSRLMQAAEAEAARRGCGQVVLDTHSFQAPGFYEKRGYEVLGAAEGYPKGHLSAQDRGMIVDAWSRGLRPRSGGGEWRTSGARRGHGSRASP